MWNGGGLDVIQVMAKARRGFKAGKLTSLKILLIGQRKAAFRLAAMLGYSKGICNAKTKTDWRAYVHIQPERMGENSKQRICKGWVQNQTSR